MAEKQRVLPDAIFVNGQIISMNPLDPLDMPQAVAVKGERIVACGSKREVLALAGDQTNIIDLNGKTMLPGFIDGHGHFPWAGNDALYGVGLYSPPIGPILNIEELLAALRKKMQTLNPGEWITGRGYDNSLLEDKGIRPEKIWIRCRPRYRSLSFTYRRIWEWLTAPL